MNKYQRLVITVAIIDLIVILLFPPFVEKSLVRNAFPTFDGFYFLLSELGRRPIDAALLSLELLWVGANLLSGWLLLSGPGRAGPGETRFSFGFGIVMVTLTNLTIVLLFPPFEQYNSVLRTTAPGFDSFYFVFGNRSARPIFLPLLQLQVFFILINALGLYLLFSAVQRSETAEQDRQMLISRPSGTVPERPSETPEQRAAAERHKAELLASLGRKKEDRRHRADPGFRGPERRKGQDRRHLT